MRNDSNIFISEIIKNFTKEKNKPRLLCLCKRITPESVDCFGWYKCKTCKGHVHLIKMAENLPEIL